MHNQVRVSFGFPPLIRRVPDGPVPDPYPPLECNKIPVPCLEDTGVCTRMYTHTHAYTLTCVHTSRETPPRQRPLLSTSHRHQHHATGTSITTNPITLDNDPSSPRAAGTSITTNPIALDNDPSSPRVTGTSITRNCVCAWVCMQCVCVYVCICGFLCLSSNEWSFISFCLFYRMHTLLSLSRWKTSCADFVVLRASASSSWTGHPFPGPKVSQL